MGSFFHILRGVTAGIAEEIENAAKSAVSPLAPYMRRLATGMIVAVCSAFSFAGALLFAAVSLFLKIADHGDLAVAALWTAGALLLIGALILSLGFSFLKRPRR